MPCNTQTNHVIFIDNTPSLNPREIPVNSVTSNIYERILTKLFGRKNPIKRETRIVHAMTMGQGKPKDSPAISHELSATFQTSTALSQDLPEDTQIHTETKTPTDPTNGPSEVIDELANQIQDTTCSRSTMLGSSLPLLAANEPISDVRNIVHVSVKNNNLTPTTPTESEISAKTIFQPLELNGRRITTQNQLDLIKALIIECPATRRNLNKMVDALNIPDVISQLVKCNGWDIRSIPCKLIPNNKHHPGEKFYLLGSGDFEIAIALIGKHPNGLSKLFDHR